MAMGVMHGGEVMSEAGGSRLGRAAQWGSVLSPLVGTGTCALTALIAYVVNAEVRAWAKGLVDLLGPLVAVVVALLVLGSVGMLAGLAWKRRRAFWRVIRPRYVPAVVWLARPVRGEVYARLGADSWVRTLGEAGARLPGLHTDALKALQFSLAALDSCAGGPCFVRASQAFSGEGGGYDLVFRLGDACNVLVRAGMVSRHETNWSDFGASVWLRSEIQVADQTIYHDAKYSSHVILPIIPADSSDLE